MKTWTAKAPANIALIKYMGKVDQEQNRPSNASLSWTLPHLLSQVEVSLSPSGEDSWEPLETEHPFEMSEVGRNKYLKHLERIKEHFGVDQAFLVRSGNHFPADCGIASSASSFAALTQAACLACSEIARKPLPSTEEQAQLSALGSGSSCRSFFSHWVHWDGAKVKQVPTAFDKLIHMVVILSAGAKGVSSSQAHQRVATSLLFTGRVERAQARLEKTLFCLQAGKKEWRQLFELSWSEFWDMHALFETSHPCFGYFHPESLVVLNQARQFWQNQGDGPLVTMDAGPNVHLLWREDQKELAQLFFTSQIQGKFMSLSNLQELTHG